jgi:hypothetical protein
MAISLTTITGAAITGLTSPTYTVSVDYPPNAWSKQWAITAIGGTQTGVDTGTSASRPWTLTWSRPQNIKQLNALDTNGQLRSVPMNPYKFIGRKGLTPLVGQPSKTAIMAMETSIPAGSDIADIPNIKAFISSMYGALYQQAQGTSDLYTTGVL